MNNCCFQIRDAHPSDIPQITRIYDFYVQNTAISFEYDSPDQAEMLARLESITQRYPYLVLEQEGNLRGYAYAGVFKGRAAYDHCCEVTIYLAPDCHKQGFGRALYTALEQRLSAMGILNLYACIGVPRDTDPYLTRNSVDFHAHMGYRPVGTFLRCGYKFDRWYDMMWMEKLFQPDIPAPPILL